ncbi:DUF3808 domain-containing protein [bacterium]|nr:DUF3808 domain-containing protein [bacterium]
MKKNAAKFIFLLIITFLFSGCAHRATHEELIPYTNRIRSEYRYNYENKTLREIVALPDNQFDLLTASLYLSKELDPSVDIDKYLDKVETLAAELAYSLKNAKNYKQKVDAICNLVWRKGYIAYKPFWQNYDANRFRDLWFYKYSNIALLLDQHKGNCVAFSILYLALAKRTGLALYGVTIPGHIFVRYDDGIDKINIEPLEAGFYFSDQMYIEASNSNMPNDLCGGYYLHNLTDKEVFGSLLLNMSAMCYEKNQTLRTLRYMNISLNCAPRDPEILTSAGITHLKLNNIENAIYFFDKALEIKPASIIVLSQKALIMRSLGDINQSNKLFRKTLNITPVRSSEWFNKGVAYFYLKKYKKAVTCINKSLDFDDKSSPAWYYLAASYAVMNKKSSSILCLKKAVALDPSFKKYAEKDNFFENIKQDSEFIKIINSPLHLNNI